MKDEPNKISDASMAGTSHVKNMKNLIMCIAVAAVLVIGARLDAKVINVPKLTIEQAIKVARDYTTTEKIDVSHHFLAAIEYKNLHNEYEKPFWRLEWRMLAGTTNGQIIIVVDSNGIVSREKNK
ncbi:MAG: hypothetical protein JWM68_2738 [Verrucomicrobiales bacterium]|nr:hypothetical protein [Verrucomicrobiales bacterium]